MTWMNRIVFKLDESFVKTLIRKSFLKTNHKLPWFVLNTCAGNEFPIITLIFFYSFFEFQTTCLINFVKA